VEFQGEAWKGAHREVELQERLQRDVKLIKILREGEMVHLSKARDGPSLAVNQLKAERGQDLKASRYGYNQKKNQDSNPNLRGFIKGLKSKRRWRLLGFCLVFKRR